MESVPIEGLTPEAIAALEDETLVTGPEGPLGVLLPLDAYNRFRRLVYEWALNVPIEDWNPEVHREQRAVRSELFDEGGLSERLAARPGAGGSTASLIKQLEDAAAQVRKNAA